MIESVDLFNPTKIAEYLTLNELNLEDELSTCARFYYLFADLAADAENHYNQLVLELEHYESNLAETVKTTWLSVAKGSDKLTETEIKRCYRRDDKWRGLKAQEINAETKFKKLDKAAKAFEMKNQSCMSLNKRQLFKVSKGMLKIDEL